VARYVLLSFDDNDDAEVFIANLHDVGYLMSVDTRTGVRKLAAAVRGLWAKPTKYCECKGGGRSGFTRGKKYGWWVHVNCGKPTKGWVSGDHWAPALGTNLLPISEDAPEHRGPGHVTHPGYKPTANWCAAEGRFMFKATPGGPCPNCNEPLTLSPIHQNVGDNAEPTTSTETTG
jgi:hypothetical protein